MTDDIDTIQAPPIPKTTTVVLVSGKTSRIVKIKNGVGAVDPPFVVSRSPDKEG